MQSYLRQLTHTWEELGRQDPLWAVVSHADKRGGRWNIAEFMETGEQAVSYYSDLISNHAQRNDTFSHVLDFGCGVGRITRAWSKRSRNVTGVDISAPMLELAKQNLAGQRNVDFVLNLRDDLQTFDSEAFDLVFSVICLQHMPFALAAKYIGEFARVCQRGGIVAFQLPSRAPRSSWQAKLRKTIVESLPYGMARLYRRWRHGSTVVFDMYYTPGQLVEQTAATAGLMLIHREPDRAAGAGTEGFFYIFRKQR